MPFDPAAVLYPEQSWYVTGGALIVFYLALRLLLVSPLRPRRGGGARERDPRLAAGLRPALHQAGRLRHRRRDRRLRRRALRQLGRLRRPDDLLPSLSAEIIIWVTVGGLGTLLGPVVGAVIIEYLVSQIGSQQVLNSNLVLGAILVGFVLLLPQGLVPTVRNLLLGGGRLVSARRKLPADRATRRHAVGAK